MKETTLAKILAVACSLGLATALAQTSTTVTTSKDAAARSQPRSQQRALGNQRKGQLCKKLH